MKRFIGFAVCLVLLSGIKSVNADIHVVTVANFFFSPDSVLVNPGDTVRWELVSGVHTTTSTGASAKVWDSGILGGAFELQFLITDGPGPFPYDCSVHPLTMTGTVYMAVTSCCINIRGDCNNDGTDANILDLNFLVNRVFRAGPAPACAVEGDVNSDGFSANILDLNFLVNRVFRAGPAPGPC